MREGQYFGYLNIVLRRISDEEKRNSAITNAMKNWKLVKMEHKKLVRKPSESSVSE